MRIIANYLPQYHVIPENSTWWGEGYTDWVGVKAAIPLYEGHNQPRVPLGGTYYSLDDIEAIRWQASLARSYGISAFGIYHYWFNSSMHLLGTPAELILQDPSIDIGFMFLWDNVSWVRTWSGVKRQNDWAPSFDGTGGKDGTDGILARLEMGGPREWEDHFRYLLPFFMDKRYVRICGLPAFGFMNPRNGFDEIIGMAKLWDDLARSEGLPGILCMTNDTLPSRVVREHLPMRFRYCSGVPQTIGKWAADKIKTKRSNRLGVPRYYDYDRAWRSILRSSRYAGPKVLLSGLVSFDDTPRRGQKARIYRGATPESFERYFTELLRISKAQGKEYVFLSAWNEWGEGMYLEPDETYGYGWLEAVSRALQKSGDA